VRLAQAHQELPQGVKLKQDEVVVFSCLVYGGFKTMAVL
jgi:hypothetical protein